MLGKPAGKNLPLRQVCTVSQRNSVQASTRKVSSSHKASCKKCEDVYIIKREDVNSRTFTIRESGRWILEEDTVYSPLHTGSAAISIEIDNVTIDLCKKTLSQGNNVDLTTGIRILAGQKNVTIINGYVDGFSQIGIDIEAAAEMIQLGDSTGRTRLMVTNCGQVGEYSNFDVASATRIIRGGIKIGTSKFFTFNADTFADPTREVNLDYVVVKQNSPVGLYGGNQQTTNVRNCNFDENYESRNSVPSDSGQLLTFDPFPQAGGLFNFVGDPLVTPEFNDYGIVDMYVYNCSASGNRGLGTRPLCLGFVFTYNANVLVEKCVAAKNTSTRKLFSFAFGGGNGSRFLNCVSTENHAGNRCDAFHQSGIIIVNGETIGYSHFNGTVYEKCVSAKNTSAFIIFSFLTLYPSDASVIDCTSSENDGGLVIGYVANGATDAPSPSVAVDSIRGLRYTGCKSINDGPNNDVTFYVSGFEMDDLNVGYLVQNCQFSHLPNLDAEINAFISDNSETLDDPLLISNSVIENNNFTGAENGIALYGTSGILVKNNNLVGNQTGVLLSPSRYGSDFPSLCNVIQENTITNSIDGIVDVSVETNNFFTSNRIYGSSGVGINVNPPPPIAAATRCRGKPSIYPTNVDAITNVVIGDSCGFNDPVQPLPLKNAAQQLSREERLQLIKEAKQQLRFPFDTED
jgi:parallel beta-helix repeat protein